MLPPSGGLLKGQLQGKLPLAMPAMEQHQSVYLQGPPPLALIDPGPSRAIPTPAPIDMTVPGR